MIGQSTASFHSRLKARYEDAIRDSLKRGVVVTGNASKELIARIQAELDVEKVQKEKNDSSS